MLFEKVEIRRLEWFRRLYWSLQLRWLSTDQLVVGLEEAATLDWILWLLLKLIASHILLGGGSFKECKWNIIWPIFQKKHVTWKVTGNSSIMEQIQEKMSKNYAEFTHQIKKFSILFGKVIRNFKRSLLCITSGSWSLAGRSYLCCRVPCEFLCS